MAIGPKLKDFSDHVLLCFSPLRSVLDPGIDHETPGADIERLVEEAIIEGVGTSAFMDCMKSDLKELDRRLPDYISNAGIGAQPVSRSRRANYNHRSPEDLPSRVFGFLRYVRSLPDRRRHHDSC